ncbi:MAG: DUF2851 family protein [Chitinophagaceae bacterium]|nr:DUF2851 family protein [Chitinophagaceae bacterium]MBK8787483.1 DUF2851 family protein [Chitinophagaceae bacterium]MBL0201455.1 DUF2851 family protein [Chitinophagaceae bacterium]
MTEKLLQYIWQFQYFNYGDLYTEEGEALQIIHPGSLNSNQGPDFSDAKIKINTTTWAGSIELHINTSDWKNHKHSNDKNYKNVILHVVWQHDINLNLPCSTLVLQDKVPKLLLSKYDELMNADSFIPCEKNIQQINSLTWQSWKERLLIERLEQRTQLIYDYLQKNNNHWEETFWWLLARNFGVKLNSVAFEKIAQSVSLNILAKHKGQIHQAEALLFGQAGLLDGVFAEDYPTLLQKEYRFLKKKYNLQKIEASLIFLRMRPSNFPSVRLAQLAMLVHNSLHLFSKIKESSDIKNIRQLLEVTANDYWHYHYTFDEISAFKKKKLGGQMIDNILINTVVPVLFAYGHYHGENSFKDKALQWLEEIKAEKNSITHGFTSLRVANKNAFDSQALIQLKNEYCNKKRCLDCSVGNKLIRKQ